MKLRDYQQEVFEKAIEVLDAEGLVYLAMKTRTGKTITSLSVANARGAKRVLFLTKKKIIPGVKSDFAASGFTFDIQILSVDSAHKAAGFFDVVIIDEAHCLGAFPKPGTRPLAIKKLVGKAEVIFLSATPTPESYSQIYHQLWVSPRSPFAAWGKFYDWAKDFVNVRQREINGFRVKDYSDARIKDIQPYLDRIMISLTQKEAGFKQEEIEEELLSVKMSAPTHALVKRLIKDRVYVFPDGCEIVCDTPAKLTSKVAQVASGTVITELLLEEEGKRRVVKVVKLLDRAKAAKVLELSRTMKIAVFYKYDAEKAMLSSVLPAITEKPDEFQRSSDKVFLSQFQSGREGIRLDTADAIVFFSPDHAYLSYEQTKNRIQDIARATKPRLIWLLGDTGVEDKIRKVVTGKSKYTSTHFRRDWL